MALFDYPITRARGTIQVEDATGVIVQTIQFENGDFGHDEMQAGYMETEILQDRGVDYAIVETKEQRIGLQFSCDATDLYDGTEKTVPDMVMGTGAWAAGTSVFGAGRPWGVKITVTFSQTPYGAAANSTYTFDKVRPIYAFAEGDPVARFTFKGIVFNPSSTVHRT
ncbi:MAG: hypothetical protein EBS48_10430 [Actinobacteria bacterium]|nr:hypothetical protein [Actinomycetota bacterium]